MYSLRVIFFGATSFGHSMTIIQALTYRTPELVGIIRLKYKLKYICTYIIS